MWISRTSFCCSSIAGDTVPRVHSISPYINLLKREGTLAFVGAPSDPLPLEQKLLDIRVALTVNARGARKAVVRFVKGPRHCGRTKLINRKHQQVPF